MILTLSGFGERSRFAAARSVVGLCLLASVFAGCSQIPGNNAFRERRSEAEVAKVLHVAASALRFQKVVVIPGPDHHHVVCGEVVVAGVPDPRRFVGQGRHALVDPKTGEFPSSLQRSADPQWVFETSWAASGCKYAVAQMSISAEARD